MRFFLEYPKMSVIRLEVGDVSNDVRERILKAVECIRDAAARYRREKAGERVVALTRKTNPIGRNAP
jgi:hypothetical protein